MVKEVCPSKFNVINVTQNIIYNFSEYLKPFFKKYLMSTNKQKFTIMAYRTLKYSKEGLFFKVIANLMENILLWIKIIG